MRIDKVVEFIHRQPFQPFDIHMSDGRVYTVDHPDFVSYSRDGSTVSFWTAEDQRLVLLDSHHITGLAIANRPPISAAPNQ